MICLMCGKRPLTLCPTQVVRLIFYNGILALCVSIQTQIAF